MGLDFLVGLYRSLKAGAFSSTLVLSYLQDLLYYVFPLLLLANLVTLDPTGWLVLIGYYVGAVGVSLKYLSSIKNIF
jgi:hypothetical protein